VAYSERKSAKEEIELEITLKYPVICLEWVRKSTKYLCQKSQFLGQYLN
jgi:hypothetical protein